MKKTLTFLIPLGCLLLILLLCWRGLALDPRHLPSALLNKPVPHFQLQNLTPPEKIFSDAALKGHPSLLIVWATWCESCLGEHAFLMKLAKTTKIDLYGIAYKDEPARVVQWLENYGNPFKRIAVDMDGEVAIDLGVYVTPELFLIDAVGIIRYKHVGPLNEKVWAKEIKPILERLDT